MGFLTFIGILFIGAAIFTLVMAISRAQGVLPPSYGLRGLRRQRAIEDSPFRLIEPLVRLIAKWIAPLPLHAFRRRAAEHLKVSGEYLGLDADDYIALVILSSSAMTLMWFFAGAPPLALVIVAILGACIPPMRVSAHARKLFGSIEQNLPNAIDLASLCMGAGLDFPGALKQVVATSPAGDDLTEEFRRILQELELGRTRRQALESFANRVPSPAIRDFVGAVIQAEIKGHPLAEVLKIQAKVSRTRRSLRIEEMASRAAVLMSLPLLFLLLSVLLIIMGPVVLDMMDKF